MGSSRIHQWETDPLFPAAEVVQDSADRMQSLYLLLLHEKSLIEEDQTDPRLLSSIEHHKRDLSTILETAKWQLEDFERATKVPSTMSESRRNGDTRHWQFITAIREHINRIERALTDFPSGYPSETSQSAMNENEADILASFLAGTSTEKSSQYEAENNHLLMRFLEPLPSLRLKEDEIVESSGGRENHGGETKGQAFHYHNQNDRDLEANDSKPDTSTRQGKWKSCSKINFVGILSEFLGKKNKKYTKRLKDGDEDLHGVSRSGSTQQSWGLIGQIEGNVRRMRLQLILTAILVLLAFYTIARMVF